MRTTIRVGAQSAESRYVTEKRNPVDVVPDPGLTDPAESDSVWDCLEQGSGAA